MTNHSSPHIAEFRDVHRDDDGVWHATHEHSGREATGDTWDAIELSALVIRVSESFKQAWS